MEDAAGMSREIGKRIREVRLARQMSQLELATKAKVSLPHISEIERGRKSMKLETFIRIIEALQVSADEILRANVPEVSRLYQNEFAGILEDCTPQEAEAMKQILLQVKRTMRP